MTHIFRLARRSTGSVWPFYCEAQIEFVWIVHAKRLSESVVGRRRGWDGGWAREASDFELALSFSHILSLSSPSSANARGEMTAEEDG